MPSHFSEHSNHSDHLNPTRVQFSATDGFPLVGVFYAAKGCKVEKLLIITSAFGVPFQYYKHIANYFAQHGISVLCFDYRGISHSQKGNIATENIRIEDWGACDLEGAITFVKQTYKPQELYCMGHSAGGQIIGLAKSCSSFDKVIVAASGLSDWRKWKRPKRYLLALIWKSAWCAIKLFKRDEFFQSNLIGPLLVPTNVVLQWLTWASSKEYLFNPQHGLDTSQYEAIKVDLLGLCIEDDWYAPEESHLALLEHYSNSKQQKMLIKPKEIGLKQIGHFGLFKKKQEIEKGIWQPMLKFLNQ